MDEKVFRIGNWGTLSDRARVRKIRKLAEDYGNDPRLRWWVTQRVIPHVAPRDFKGQLRAIFLEGFMTVAVATGCLVAGIVMGGAARQIEERFKNPAPDEDLEYDDYDLYDDDEDEDDDRPYLAPPPPIIGVAPVPGGATAVVIGLW